MFDYPMKHSFKCLICFLFAFLKPLVILEEISLLVASIRSKSPSHLFSFFPVKSNREISIKYSRVFNNFSLSIFFKEDALNFAATVGYPCLLRPSYVLRYQLTL